jgi:hypothetical protein
MKCSKKKLREVEELNLLDPKDMHRDLEAIGKIVDFGAKVIDDPAATTREKIDAAREVREAATYLLNLRDQVMKEDAKKKPEAETAEPFNLQMYG